MSITRLTAVARREYTETVKTKAFLFGILLMPGIIIGMILLSTKMTVQAAQTRGPIPLAVIDRTNRVAAKMIELIDQNREPSGWQHVEVEVVQPAGGDDRELQPLKRRVREGSLFGVVEIPAEAIEGKRACVLSIRAAGIDDRLHEVRQLINEAVKRIRFADAGVNAEQVAQLSRPVSIQQQDIRDQQERSSDEVSNIMAPFVFTFLMFMGVMGVSQGLLTSVIEEKSSRVVEVLLSALSPFELMAGKILGMAGVGLTMMLLWAGVGYSAAAWRHAQHLVQVNHLGQFIMYYVLGFLLISSILAAMGSACNTLKEAQPLMAPLTLLIVVPMLFWMQIVNQPNSIFATALTFVPPMTPFIMILRMTSPEGSIPVWQQVVAPVWLAGWVLAAMWAAGRVFRIGLLMYGKPPGLRELATWIRYR